MSPAMNGRVEKFAHFNTCGSSALSCGQLRVTSHKNLGSKVRPRLTDFRELTAREITGFDCTCFQMLIFFR